MNKTNLEQDYLAAKLKGELKQMVLLTHAIKDADGPVFIKTWEPFFLCDKFRGTLFDREPWDSRIREETFEEWCERNQHKLTGS